MRQPKHNLTRPSYISDFLGGVSVIYGTLGFGSEGVRPKVPQGNVAQCATLLCEFLGRDDLLADLKEIGCTPITSRGEKPARYVTRPPTALAATIIKSKTSFLPKQVF